MNTPTTTQTIRPAGAGHETLYVLLFCALVLLVAGSVVMWHGKPAETVQVAAHQLDARRDLSAGEQGVYADLRVTLDEIQLLQQEQQTLPTPAELDAEGFAPFARDASAVSRGGHTWQLLEGKAYLGLSQANEVAGSFLMRLGSQPDSPADIWLNRNAALTAPADLADAALNAAGWQQVVAQFDAGVTRQHRH
ncbi:hypothetical protein G3435_21200 [Pseudomonas sp. MAFF212428]|uniref:Periplasmic protein n=1 Tax=Pseudomonas brassicae TaxID=2708063 RepID=A0A6B3NV35_9PSED|nr:DUF6162 family protein [Pseudomonas brassicae]NER61799.1 hypothetical protein [Pseudomonas brassicae]NER65836.1 hypothetical protein [Pseudomonas brassicae]